MVLLSPGLQVRACQRVRGTGLARENLRPHSERTGPSRSRRPGSHGREARLQRAAAAALTPPPTDSLGLAPRGKAAQVPIQTLRLDCPEPPRRRNYWAGHLASASFS